jgi:hypothetical protein
MRTLALPAVALSAILAACGSGSPAPEATSKPAPKAPVKPPDESYHLPKTNLVESHVVDTAILGKSFMPGGTVGHYRKGKTEYDMFVCRLGSPTAAAVLLPDWSHALADSKLEPSFGGYFGSDEGRPVFVFAKGVWLAGVAGLPEKDADREARALAAMLN